MIYHQREVENDYGLTWDKKMRQHEENKKFLKKFFRKV